MHPLFALLIGAVAGAQIPVTTKFVSQKLKIDDPCGVGPVHAAPGLLGGLAVAVWALIHPEDFHGYHVSIFAQVLGTVAALVFGVVSGAVIFGLLKWTTGLRVSEEEELSGLDLSEHGMAAYPEFAFASDAVKPTPALHVLSGVKVSEIMTEVLAVSPMDTLDAAQDIMFAREVFALPVLDEDAELCGIVTMADITKISKSERASVRVAAVFTKEVQSAFPDQTVHEVVERMRERYLANFPVVSRRNETQLLGMISKSDVVKAYRRIALEAVS